MRTPDFENLLSVLRCEKPNRPVLFEFVIDRHVSRALLGDEYAGFVQGDYYFVATVSFVNRLFCNVDLIEAATGSRQIPETLSEWLHTCRQVVEYGKREEWPLISIAVRGFDRKTMMTLWKYYFTQLNQEHANEIGDPEIQTTIAQQEMAFRMQASVPELTDISSEPASTLELYGPEVHKSGSFARNCLLARRMAERGVRFVQVYHRGWDHHAGLPEKMRGQCYDIDQPCAALIKDLKRQGLFEDTLIVFSGEFGRTVYCQGNQSATNYGRDHHSRCFTAWMAGAGIKGGIEHGRTDEYSYNIVDRDGQKTTRFEDDAVHIRDLNATILHQLGIDHRQLTFRFQGLDQKLTGVEEESHVIQKILS